MHAQILLADSAQVVNGKLYLLGGGWNQIGPKPTAMAVVLRFLVPWDQTNQKHRWSLRLLDEDGHPVMVGPAGSGRPIEVSGQFEAGRPPGTEPGTETSIPVAVNVGAIPLPAGRRLEWRLFVDEETHEDWRESFRVRPE